MKCPHCERTIPEVEEQHWLEDELIEVMRLASRGLWAPDKDDAITDTLRLHGIRLMLEANTERYEALLDRVQKRRLPQSQPHQEEK